MKYNIFIYVSFIASCCILCSCPSDDIVTIGEHESMIDEPSVVNEMEIDSFLWQRPIGDDITTQSGEFFTVHPVLHDGKVIWNIPLEAGFVALDKADGATVWDNRGQTTNAWNAEIPRVLRDFMYYVKANVLRKMNLNTGDIEIAYDWPISTEELSRSISIDEQYLYCPLEQTISDAPHYTEIIRSPLSDLAEDSWERFGKRTPTDYNGCDPSYNESTFHTNEKGDRFIIAVNNVQCTLTEGFGTLTAINLTTKELEWEIIGDSYFTVDDLIYENGTVYFHSRNKLFSVNAETGEVKWKCDISANDHNIIRSSYNLEMVSHQNSLTIVGHNNRIVAFNKSDGSVSWSRDFQLTTSREDRESTGSKYGTINVHNGKLYYRNNNGSLMVLKLTTGELRRFHLPEFSEYNDEGDTLYQVNFGRHDIIVDEDGTIYAADGFRFLAFKLPEW